MKTATPELVTLLNTSVNLAYADLFTFTLLGGSTVLRYTGADRVIPWGGNTFQRGPIIKRGRTRLRVGIQVDTLELTISAGPETTVNGKPLMAFLAAGGLDSARVLLERAFAPSANVDPTGVLHVFAGRVSDIDMGRYEARVTAACDLELLDTQVPRNIYQPPCVNTLYNTSCGVNRAAFTSTGTVSSAATPTRSAFKTGLAQPNKYYELGVVVFTSGANSGISRTIKTYLNSGGYVETIAPFPFAPAVGDTFSIVPGCDKTVATCNGRFNNKPRYGGFPFIPKPETVT